MKKKHYILIGVAVLLLLLIVAAYRLFFRTKVWEVSARAFSNGGRSTVGRSTPRYTDEKFPIRQGMKGDKIAQMQRFLNITDDGVWGPQTTEAFKKSKLYAAAGSKVELSDAVYASYQIAYR